MKTEYVRLVQGALYAIERGFDAEYVGFLRFLVVRRSESCTCVPLAIWYVCHGYCVKFLRNGNLLVSLLYDA